MKTSSFDILDTCFVWKCGTHEAFFDVFSLRAFNGEVEEWERQEFVAARRMAEQSLPSFSTTLKQIWDTFEWTHPQLKHKDYLCQLEQEMERELLVPVLEMRDKVNECRAHGDHIIFISDMYLSSAFLCDVMRKHGFLQEGDSLYFSCECNAEKRTGELFKYICEKEGLSFHRWHHYGDNSLSDYKVPRQLGIKSTLVKHEYTYYQKQWMNSDYSLGFNYTCVLSGIGRALRYSTKWTTHTDFVLDIIAPFYCSLVYRMLKDAEKRGIKRLYFCARDAYMMYLVAQKYQFIFPSIECKFLYISRKALYEGEDDAKIAYFKSVGLATEEYVGIVDQRSTGKTMAFLNNFLLQHGYRPVRGYYYELFCSAVDVKDSYFVEDYYTELNDLYNREWCSSIGAFSQIFETFFPLNTLPKTVNYRMSDEVPIPVFGSDDTDNTLEIDKTYIDQKDVWAKVHEDLIFSYIDAFVCTGLFKFSDYVFHIANNTIMALLREPNKYYLAALECMYGKINGSSEFVPFVKRASWLHLLMSRGRDSIWKQATIAYNGFLWFQNLHRRILYGESI